MSSPHVEIKLTKGYVAKVSLEDYARVSSFRWCASVEGRQKKKVYAIRWKSINGIQRKIRMHRFIMGLAGGAEDPVVVDHLNDDGLDNRRENLEIISQEENVARIENWNRKIEEPAL